MKVIALVGPQDSGKTLTICRCAHLLRAQKGVTNINFNTKQKDATERKLRGEKHGDILIAFSLNGVRVVICSAGDNARELNRAFQFAKDEHADLLVTATHPEWKRNPNCGAWGRIMACEDRDTSISRFRTQDSDEQRASVELDANRLVEKVLEFCH